MKPSQVVCLALTVGLSLFGSMSVSVAAPWETGGHAKYQFTRADYGARDAGALFGDDPALDHGLDLRLKAEGREGRWDASVHYEVLAIAGDSVALRRLADLPGLVARDGAGLPDDARRLFDLTDEISEGGRRAAVHRLDRLSLGHGTPERVWRFGRQAISWGNGLVFHPFDFVNPFSPIAIDKDYKTGDDMAYAQWVLARGDAQAMLVPRREPESGSVRSDQSSAAGKLRMRAGPNELDLLVARHYDDGLGGIGLARSIGGAVWRADATVTDTADDPVYALVTNIDYSWTWFGRNTYGYAEYYRNGFGETDRARYARPDPELLARIERGELFTLGRDYLALGLQVELTPLFNLYNNVVWNLNDGSGLWQVRGLYDWRQDVQLQVGLDVPAGEPGDEFGGIPLSGTDALLSPARSLYLRAAYYF